MSVRGEHSGLVVASIIAALLLTIIPLPEVIQPLAPYWLALVFIYWGLESASLRHLGQAFACGLLLDIFTGALLGQHALSLVILSYLLGRFRHRIRFFPPWQQALAVLALLVNDRIIQLWIIALAGRGLPDWSFWIQPVVAFVLWPWIFLLMDALRSRARLHS